MAMKIVNTGQVKSVQVSCKYGHSLKYTKRNKGVGDQSNERNILIGQ